MSALVITAIIIIIIIIIVTVIISSSSSIRHGSTGQFERRPVCLLGSISLLCSKLTDMD